MKIVSIVVTYQPDMDQLEELLFRLEPQVDNIIIVDNNSDCSLSDWFSSGRSLKTGLIQLDDNKGISFAHNKGISIAVNLGADFILLMDQDSIPASNMVDCLLQAISTHDSVAAVGPRYIDERQNNQIPFLRVEGLKLKRCACPTDSSVVKVDYLVSSGSLIPVDVITQVGKMREDLFIDYVDIEWGMRAKEKGFQCFGVCSALMSHSLGDDPIHLFGKKFPCRSPLRHYYMFRNALLLYTEPYIPLSWKLIDGSRLILKFIAYSLFTSKKWSHFRMMCLGVIHGLVGRTGKYSISKSEKLEA